MVHGVDVVGVAGVADHIGESRVGQTLTSRVEQTWRSLLGEPMLDLDRFWHVAMENVECRMSCCRCMHSGDVGQLGVT